MEDNMGLLISQALEPVLMWFSSFVAPNYTANGINNIVSLLTVACLAVVGVVFMWWGVRKVVSMIMSAFRSGRISL